MGSEPASKPLAVQWLSPSTATRPASGMSVAPAECPVKPQNAPCYGREI